MHRLASFLSLQPSDARTLHLWPLARSLSLSLSYFQRPVRLLAEPVQHTCWLQQRCLYECTNYQNVAASKPPNVMQRGRGRSEGWNVLTAGCRSLADEAGSWLTGAHRAERRRRRPGRRGVSPSLPPSSYRPSVRTWKRYIFRGFSPMKQWIRPPGAELRSNQIRPLRLPRRLSCRPSVNPSHCCVCSSQHIQRVLPLFEQKLLITATCQRRVTQHHIFPEAVFSFLLLLFSNRSEIISHLNLSAAVSYSSWPL